MLQATSRVTWEGIQTWMGTVVSQWRNVAYKHNLNVAYYHGATLVNRNNPKDEGHRGMTLGSYINGQNLNASATDAIFIHEYGHTIQSKFLGPRFLYIIGIPSLISCTLWPGERHNNRWYEQNATTLGSNYLENNHKEEYEIYTKKKK